MVKVEIKSFNFDLRNKNAHGDIFHHKDVWRKTMQGMILAAGTGKRLKELTKDNTKGMLKVNRVTLIE